MFRSRLLLFGLLVSLCCGVFMIGCVGEESEDNDPFSPLDLPYLVNIDPADFVDTITGNTFMPLVSGTTFFYVGEDEDGILVEVEEYVTDSLIIIMGVTCIVVEAREYEDG